MTQISLSKALALIDAKRGPILKYRRNFPKDSNYYELLSMHLRNLNTLKKEFTDLLDTDEPPLGL